MPVIISGNGLTVIVAVVIQPAGAVYVIVAVVPDIPPDTAVKKPVLRSIAATNGAAEIQVPPVEALVNVAVCCSHKGIMPAIDGRAFTVITVVEKQPAGMRE